MLAEAMVKAAAVGGIAMVWAKFTLETFKICKQIVYSNLYRCDECSNNFTKELFSSKPGICKFCEEKNTCAMNAMNVILTIEKIFPEI